ncbi:MAG: AAA family ATPase [Lachnospiraceae bacterium]|nr:AAA family ATPase [Lachnospiraceae bacterium]MCM1230482.1 AAA family ATPase [Ruminococcus flavefaciens]
MSDVFRFCISFSQTWILSKRGNSVLPPEEILLELEKVFIVTEQSSKISECTGVINSAGHDEKAVIQIIAETINKTYGISEKDDIYKIDISEYTENKLSISNECKEATKDEPAIRKKTLSSTVEKTKDVEQLVGADDFKSLANECKQIAKRLIENQLVDSFTSRAYVVSINDGCGLTTYLNAFADLVDELNLFRSVSSAKVAEVTLNPPDGQNSDNAFSNALYYFQGRSSGKVISIDISEWMTKLTDKLFRDFLKHIDEHIGENIVFFRVPFVEQNIIADIKKNLSDILTVTELSVPPFTNEELIQCAASILSERVYDADEDVWSVFNARIASEKSDGRFYGINTVNKIIREMLYAKQLHDVEFEIDDKIIHKEDILSIVDSDSINNKSGFEQLDELVGMESIQGRVKEIIAQIEASVSNNSLETPCIHMRFVGNPGTGKTTVARIVGTILKEKGILRSGSFFEHSGRDLCGRFVGETAPKTSAICRDAYGSVLFIDEAYSLYRDEGFSSADYGREAIDTLVAEMENHRTDLMVIMAGYPDEMEKLMSGNVGLKSRMPYLIEFPNYTREQLADIFFTMAKKSFSYDNSFSNAVKSYFSTLSEDIINAKDFSNARFVRNLFERTWGKAALRCQMSQTKCTALTVEDFALAISDKEFHSIMEQKKRTIGFN